MRIKGLEKKPQNLLPCVMEVACGQREFLSVFGNDYNTPDGTGVRDYIHVTDLASGHVKSLEYITNNNKSITVNLGSETGISVQSIVDTARIITGKPIPTKFTARREGDTDSLYASSEKAHTLLGWKPQYSSVDTLIKTTWDIYQSAFKT
jgi:UDP-glucose 4-epimerase